MALEIVAAPVLIIIERVFLADYITVTWVVVKSSGKIQFPCALFGVCIILE